MISIKSQSPNLTSVPPTYTITKTPNDEAVTLDHIDPEVKIPIIDFSLLTSSNPDQRSKTIAELGRACEDWGFFMVINHCVPERLMSAVIDGCRGFFDLSEEEKLEFEGKHVLDPIRYGTSFNTSVEKVFYWRDFLKVIVNPHFQFPNKPSEFSEIAFEYCKKTREVVMGILEGISENLGLEANYIYKTLNLDSGVQVFAANLYPPCPQPELAMGLPPHSDHGLLTLLIQNGIGGLQIQHEGKWVNVNPNIPNALLVNTADHLEILSNRKYKSVVHRAIVNKIDTRISLAIANGPAFDAVVSPASKLVENHSPAYTGMKYRDYMELQQSSRLTGKLILDRLRL
ncbi:Oxoglutarate/iron-dependent dioxygenase [Parasponia andersonii]|uniref:Oxoglutarate/iron-dependent dioxygenase n=1 Tax=Parasponia andersonii TaxID=3476 RepID=A0A2P5A902_PARAD|nr:Oxoglutarate/iron-dependent dioxygenase [Parasponia andersonii]